MKVETKHTVLHSTFVIQRRFPVAPEKVFAAYADPAKKNRWFADEEQSAIESFEMDFRVGGRETKCFRTKDHLLCRNDTVYTDIVPNARIVFAYTMTVNGQRISSSQATTEFREAPGGGTDLWFTEQAAFFEGADGPAMREGGWRVLIEQLAAELAT